MKFASIVWGVVLTALALVSARSDVLTSLPGPDDQGGMIMPMVTLSGTTLGGMFTPPGTHPILDSLEYWSAGDTLDPSAAWYALLDPVGGAGYLFNSQYGFTFMGSVPSGRALGVRLTSSSSGDLQFWNYVRSQNRFDEVFTGGSSQVLWNGSMWHSYATLPATAAPGIYTATFEVFIADTTFTAGTGFADYSPTALAAGLDTDYSTRSFTLTWEVIPEPSTGFLLAGGVALLAAACRRRQKR